MLSEKQLKEINTHLNNSQNPLFFFDNDADGLCSFLILQRYIRRGKGIPVRSFPDLNKSYVRRIKELNADYVFILDKPVVSQEFFEEVRKINVPIVWIDHHAIDKELIPSYVNYYNPLLNNDKSNEPVTYLCYKATGKKEDSWIAIVGCVADKFVPEFYNDFAKENPDLSFDSEEAFDILYRSEIGKIAKIFNFALKDRITNVINMLKFLVNVKSPYEVLKEDNKNYSIYKRFNFINKKYSSLLVRAEEYASDENILFFKYGGDLSISSELSNELKYKHPKKIIVVIYVAGAKANISVRGDNVKDLVLKSIKDLEDANGGGHEKAVGAQIKTEDIEKFKENLIFYLNK